MTNSTDPLARAIELSLRFASNQDTETVEAFLREHEDLREILEPLLDSDPLDDTRQVLGDFELVRELGRGGMGVVYEAVQTLLGRTVALKLLPPHRALAPRALAMFRREATLAASLDHPGIARVLEFQEVDGQLALAMELVDGMPLDDVLENLETLDPGSLTARDLAAAAGVTLPGNSESTGPEAWRGSYESAAVELTRQVAEALAHAHSRGVVHRDIKPGNILITPDGRAVLTDFGLAREDGAMGITRTGEFSGTYQYAAPEQLEGRLDEIDGRADVYALGATLYELLTLQRPLQAESLSELIQLIKREDPPPPSRYNPNVDGDLESVTLYALEKEPTRRYASAEEFALDLGNVLARRPVKARRLTTSVRTIRWIDRNRLVSAFVALLCVSVLTVSVFWTKAARAGERWETLWVGAALDAVEQRARLAHPAWPRHADELADLVHAVEADLLPMRAAHARALAELREGNLRPAASSRSSGRSTHPGTARLADLPGLIRRLSMELKDPGVTKPARQQAEAEIAAMRDEVADIERLIALSDRVEIADPRAAALHDRLEEQLYRLRATERTLLPDLRFRLAWARGIRRDSIEQHAARWQAAAQRVAADAQFEGTQLLPQLGLVPLGPDPDSKLEEFAHLVSGAAAGHVPERGPDGKLALDLDHGVVFVLMPGGAFTPTTPLKEKPFQHRVRLDPFLLAKHELSRAQWQRLARGLPGLRWRDGGIADVRNHGELQKPVNGITWQMCARLFRRYAIDLPSAVQWDYAARFGGGVDNTPATLARVANLLDLSYRRARPHQASSLQFDDGFAGLAPIHSMAATPAGLHHLLGNVCEWCRDMFYLDIKSYFRIAPRDGDGLRAIEPPKQGLRVLNGSHWQSMEPLRLYDRWTANSTARRVGVRPMRRLMTEREQ